MTDLATLDTRKGGEDGATLDLKHPATGQPIGATIALLGADSDAYNDKMLELQRRHMERVRRNPKARRSPEELLEDAIELLVAVTTGYDLELDGQKLSFSAMNAQKLYTRFEWIREQADEFIRDRGNFLPKAASGS
jgi:hypothetical protein